LVAVVETLFVGGWPWRHKVKEVVAAPWRILKYVVDGEAAHILTRSRVDVVEDGFKL